MKQSNCESCSNYLYDDEAQCYYCDVNLDEDEMLGFLRSQTAACAYYSYDNEYKIVEKQN